MWSTHFGPTTKPSASPISNDGKVANVKQSVEVEIAGQKLVIRSDEGPAYVQELADFVDAQVREIAGGARTTFNLQRVALLVAVQIADELFREKDLHRQFGERMQGRLQALDVALSQHEKRLDELEEPQVQPADEKPGDDAPPPQAPAT